MGDEMTKKAARVLRRAAALLDRSYIDAHERAELAGRERDEARTLAEEWEEAVAELCTPLECDLGETVWPADVRRLYDAAWRLRRERDEAWATSARLRHELTRAERADRPIEVGDYVIVKRSSGYPTTVGLKGHVASIWGGGCYRIALRRGGKTVAEEVERVESAREEPVEVHS